jgi:voltage-gated potassium channel
MLAQAAMNRGLVDVLGELLTYQHGNEFYRIAIPESWVGASFDQKLSEVRSTTNVILVAVHPQAGEAKVNPENYKFQLHDDIIVISRGTPKLS